MLEFARDGPIYGLVAETLTLETDVAGPYPLFHRVSVGNENFFNEALGQGGFQAIGVRDTGDEFAFGMQIIMA